jgi:putative ABC transport system permease protein
MASIARKNLFEDIPRFIVAQAGIMFAVSLVTIQTGILNGFTRSTGVLIDRSQADLWVASKDMVYLELTLPMPAGNLAQVQALPGINRAEPLLLGGGIWRNREGRLSTTRIFGFDPSGELFNAFEVTEGSLSALKQPYTIMVDRANLKNLHVEKVGDTANIGALSAKIVGMTQGSQSIASGNFLFSSLENTKAYATGNRTANLNCRMEADQFLCTNVYEQSAGTNPAAVTPTPLTATDPISYILVRAQAGQDLEALKRQIEAKIPDVRVYTRSEMAQITRRYWVRRTGVGFILGLGAAVGFIVGVVIVGQILYSSVSDHLKEFATLKAMGVSDRVLYSIIIEQSLWMAVLGYIPSMALCLGLGAWTFTTQGVTILITPLMATGVLGVTIFMCVGSALFAIQKVTHVDPAVVFKS